jgi:hypothetical protein
LTATPLRIILQWCIELHPKSGRFFPYVWSLMTCARCLCNFFFSGYSGQR